MKKKTLALLVGAALFLTACGPKAPPAQPGPPPAPVETVPEVPPEPSSGEDTVWEAQGYTLETPASWDWLAVNVEDGAGQSDETIFALYHDPTYSEGENGGWIMSICRWDHDTFQERSEIVPVIGIATDDDGYVFARVDPSDVQITDIDTYNEMVEVVNSEEMQAVLSDFIARNGLDPIPEA